MLMLLKRIYKLVFSRGRFLPGDSPGIGLGGVGHRCLEDAFIPPVGIYVVQENKVD